MDVNTLLDNVVEDYLDRPYQVIDFLPRRVPEGSSGQFFAIERHFLEGPLMHDLFRHFATILLKLNCYYDLHVCLNSYSEWLTNPEPQRLEGWVLGCADGDNEAHHLAIVVSAGKDHVGFVMLDSCDLNMTVYGASDELANTLDKLASAEGVFMWDPKLQ